MSEKNSDNLEKTLEYLEYRKSKIMCTLEYLENKRKEVLEKIKPICEIFQIDFDYIINKENLTETLVLNGQKIGCSCDSISAILEEVIGYIFVKQYDRWWYHKPQTLKAIKKYWID